MFYVSEVVGDPSTFYWKTFRRVACSFCGLKCVRGIFYKVELIKPSDKMAGIIIIIIVIIISC